MSQDSFTGATYPDPNQPQAPAGYPTSSGSANYPPTSYPSASQPSAYDPYAQQYPQSAPPAAYYAPQQGQTPPESSGAIGLLFDFGMTKVATPKIGKILYIGTLALGALGWLFGTFTLFRVAFATNQLAGMVGGSDVTTTLMAVAFFLLGWIPAVIGAGLVRVFVEFAASTIEATNLLKSGRGQ